MNPTDKKNETPIGNPNFSGITTDSSYSNTPITSSSLTPTPSFKAPEAQPTPNYSAIAQGASAGASTPSATYTTPNGATVDVTGKIITPAQESTSYNLDENINRLLAGTGYNTGTQTSLTQQYKDLTTTPDFIQRQKNVDDLNAQLVTLQNEARAIPLQSQQDATGKGVTRGGLTPIDTAALRNNAIQTLSVSAQLAGAQGRLETATNNINKILDLTYKDQQNEIARNDKLYERAYTVATNEQKIQLDKLKAENDAKKQQLDDLQALKEKYIDIAKTSGDFKTASVLASATTNEQLQSIVSKMTQPVKYDTFTQNGVTYQGQKDPVTGQFKPETIRPLVGGGGGGGNNNDFSLAKNQANINELDNLLKSGGLSSSVGTSFLTTAPNGFWGAIGRVASLLGIPSAIGGTYRTLTGERQNFIAGVEQIRSNLNLDTLIKAKSQGATFGALSDQELKVLASAGTKIGTWAVKNKNGDIVGYNASEKDFKTELDKINNFAKLDYLLKGGAVEEINGQVMQDGTVWVENSDGTLTKIYPR